jgi:excisionase family DNA binding protein
MTPNEPLLTADEVAGIVKLDPETIRRWARDDLLPSIKLPGGQWRFRQGDVEALLRGEFPASTEAAL